MGAARSKAKATQGKESSPSALIDGLDKRVGRFSVYGRYHTLPHQMEDDYDILDKVLGSGYNGVVRMARRKGATREQKFAVKTFKLNNIKGAKREQLDSEVNVFLGMDHPHVARLFDVYETPTALYLVMECLEGGELFDRVTERKRFSEVDACDAARQMLLAVNYLHTHGIVHRDLKLENFLYDCKNGDHLKLIDFGFSKAWDPNLKMHVSCGTLSYVAPEVLEKNYTQKCDLWSLGVIAFILLAGYMPFSGDEATQTMNILAGRYTLKKERWSTVSQDGLDFVQSLLQVNPSHRLTAEQALKHGWITNLRRQMTDPDETVVDALRNFGKTSKFRRCCLEMMAWSLSNEERSKVRDYFLALDTNQQGTITLMELKRVMVDKFHISDDETKEIFEALDSNNDDTIHYSDFLAAMLSTRIALHSDLIRAAFQKFDEDSSGYITLENLRQVVGDSFEGEQVEVLIKEADLLQDGRISYPEFVAYLEGKPLDMSQLEASAQLVDKQVAKQGPMEKSNGFLNVAPTRKDSKGSKGAAGGDQATCCCIS
mmetsp:Transcript_51788/g.152619  ORF Transcript_51788/g.152619 Transcript_51788/m.152619 type:complete len:543 (-) Transcript_51788:97-1725(-)